MFMDAMEFLEEERDAWRPFEALAELSDAELERSTDADGPGHGWSGRDLAAHLVSWQLLSLQAARELAVDEQSATIARMRAEAPEDEHHYNDQTLLEWRARPPAEVRAQLTEVPGELRGYLTVVPEARWIKHPDHSSFFLANTTEHYADHTPELAAVLAELGRG